MFFNNILYSLIPARAICATFALLLIVHSNDTNSNNRFSIHPWPLSQKLSQETILSIVHAKNGKLWIATLSGIDSFDGNRLTKYRPHKTDGRHIASSSIVHILESESGNIFVATKDAGLLVFDENANRFSSPKWLVGSPPSGGRISSAFSDLNGDFWIGYESGKAFRFSPPSNTIVEYSTSLDERIIDFAQDPDGSLYIATVSGEILVRQADSNDWEKLHLDSSCKKKISSLEEISAISNKFLWLGTSGAGLLILDIVDGSCAIPEFVTSDKLDIAMAHVHEIYTEPGTGNTWVGTDQGLYQIDERLHITVFDSENSNLTDNEVASIEPHGDDAFWIGTYKGLNYLVPSIFESYDQRSGGQLRSVVAIDGSSWVGNVIATYNGLFIFDPQTMHHHNIRDLWPGWNLHNNQIMSMKVTPEGMWIGYRAAGLEFLSKKADIGVISWRAGSSNGLSVDAVSSVLSTRSGIILVGTYGGGLNVVAIDKPTEIYSVGNDRVIMLHQTKDDTVWVGTESGLFIFNPELGISTKVELKSLDEKSQTRPIVWDMEESENGVLWLATMHHGVFLWDRKKGEQIGETSAISQVSSTIEFGTVYSLKFDNLGFVWCSTDAGLIRIDPVTHQSRIFTQQHGLQNAEFDFGVSHKDTNGYIYFGGSEGYTRFDPALPNIRQKEPKILVSKITFADRVVQSFPAIKLIEKIQLTHKDYFVQFDFSVLDFLDPEKNQYRYMLEGFDHDWVENGTRNSATYTSLPPGDYTLRVQGANSAAVWNREGLSLNIEVLPPPWKTWWAYTIYAVALCLLFWVGKRAYDRSAVHRRATALAAEMFAAVERADDEIQEQLEIHDDLVKSVYRHSVSTLNLLSEVIAIKGSGVSGDDAIGMTDANLKRVAALALLEDCLYYQNELLLADLNKYTNIIISRLLKDSPIGSERIITINEVTSRALPLDQASPLAIVLYELLENAIQHAFEDPEDAHYLQVTLASLPSEQPGIKYRLTVEDDGTGIPTNIDPLSSQSPGLHIVTSMVQKLSGEMSCKIDGGTLFNITFHCPDY